MLVEAIHMALLPDELAQFQAWKEARVAALQEEVRRSTGGSSTGRRRSANEELRRVHAMTLWGYGLRLRRPKGENMAESELEFSRMHLAPQMRSSTTPQRVQGGSGTLRLHPWACAAQRRTTPCATHFTPIMRGAWWHSQPFA